MAGHSQFKNIMHRKGKQDAQKSKLFGKLAREITVAAKLGTPDPAMNPRLRAAVIAARQQNMPKDNIERAIKKATGGDSESYDEIRYEGYGPGGVAVIVEALTDNRNRAASDIRSFFAKSGGNLGETGSVAFMFDRTGVIEYDASKASDDAMLDAAIEAGADDVVSSESGHEIYASQETFREVAKALEAKFGEARKAALTWKPHNTVAVDDETGEKLWKLMDLLNEHDDVQTVYAMTPPPIRQPIRIIGIDPGLRRTGWGVIETEGNRLVFIGCGSVEPPDDLPLASRLLAIHEGLASVLGDFRPAEAAVEQTFVNKDGVATLKLGQARGVAMLAPAMFGISVAEYAPNQVKKTVVGAGHADKNQILVMLKILLPKAEPKSPDAADALAIAITHAHHRPSATLRLKVVEV